MDKMWNHEVEDGIGFEFLPKFAKKIKQKKGKQRTKMNYNHTLMILIWIHYWYYFFTHN